MSTQPGNTQPSDPTPEQPIYNRPKLDAKGQLTVAELRHRRAWMAYGYLADAGLVTAPRLTDVEPSQEEQAFRDMQYAYRQILSMLEFFDGEEGQH